MTQDIELLKNRRSEEYMAERKSRRFEPEIAYEGQREIW